MGQLQSSENSGHKFSPQDISSRFATKCGQQFTGIELWAFKDVFRKNGAVHNSTYYWTEKEFTNFLEIPDAVSDSATILYAMVHYLCAFPFLRPRVPPLAFSQVAPTPLTFESMVKVVVLFTGRYKSILTSDYDFLKLLFCAIAYYEEVLENDREFKEKRSAESYEEATEEYEPSRSATPIAETAAAEKPGFWDQKLAFFDSLSKSDKNMPSASTSVSSADDEMLNVDLEKITSWYDLDLIKTYDSINIELLRISPTSLYHLFVLLLAIGPLQGPEPISLYAEHFTEPKITKYREIAKSMTRSFYPKWTIDDPTDQSSVMENGISYSRFYTVIKSVMPFAFDGLAIIFEHFLFNQKYVPDAEADKPKFAVPEFVGSPTDHPFASPNDHDGLEELEDEEFESTNSKHTIVKAPRIPEATKLMGAPMIAQLATFMDVNSFQLYGGLKKLYVGSEAGFSMGSFEQKVFKWNAPTILLVHGYMLSNQPRGARERAFFDQLPPVRYGNSAGYVKKHSDEVLFGAVVNTAWKLSNKACFGDASTALFQLSPIQDVFRPTSYNENYAYFSKNLGIGFGNLPPKQNSHQNNGLPQYSFGDVSLTLEHSLEFGVFRHVGSETFKSSQIREHVDFEDRFAITELEVWGVGADDVLRQQQQLWQWEEAEALRRKNVNLSKDIEESRALLEMAGLVGGGGKHSGGSV
ncbi:TLD-domain-containing protein [Limtongia smithiae]|uniref:TLD-domain-containing protein n=1 Tax=Limtongia smithiae TaxID=1125753 RepID=UPI0034CE52CA